MEMRVDFLDLKTLPESEIRLLELLNTKSDSFLYLAGFHAEEMTGSELSKKLESYNKYSNLVIARVGSAGRFDGGGLGDFEFIVLTTSLESGEILGAPKLEELLMALSKNHTAGIQTITKSSVEHKNLDVQNEELLYHQSGSKTPYPGRILEADFIAGNNSLFIETKRRVLEEIKRNSKHYKRMKSELSDYKKCCLTGKTYFKKNEIVQFENSQSEYSIVMYHPESERYGFKYGFLRYYQTAISLLIFRYMREKNIEPKELVDLPSSVEERVRYLLRKGWVNDEDVIIKACYIYVRVCNIQTMLKAQYYRQSKKNREIVVFEMKGRSIDNVQDSIIEFGNAHILKL